MDADRVTRPADDVRVGRGDQLVVSPTVDMLEGVVDAFDGQVRVEDHDPVRGGVEQGVETLLLEVDLSVEAGVVDGDGGLRREGTQQGFVVGGEEVGIIAEDEDHADDLAVRGERDARAVEQTHADGVGQVFQHAVEFGHVEVRHLFFGEQGREVTEEGGRDVVRGRDAPALALFERDQASLSRQHFDGDLEDARQQFLEVEFLGEQAGDFEQVVSLADAEVWEHGNWGLVMVIAGCEIGDRRCVFRVYVFTCVPVYLCTTRIFYHREGERSGEVCWRRIGGVLTEILQKRDHVFSQLIGVISAFHDDRGRQVPARRCGDRFRRCPRGDLERAERMTL